MLCSGSRDKSILQWDHRMPVSPTRRLLGHTQEVCGLKWSPDHQMLASGGNDNKVLFFQQDSFLARENTTAINSRVAARLLTYNGPVHVYI